MPRVTTNQNSDSDGFKNEEEKTPLSSFHIIGSRTGDTKFFILHANSHFFEHQIPCCQGKIFHTGLNGHCGILSTWKEYDYVEPMNPYEGGKNAVSVSEWEDLEQML